MTLAPSSQDTSQFRALHTRGAWCIMKMLRPSGIAASPHYLIRSLSCVIADGLTSR
ncbi:MAG: hypothetical protein RL088_623 [Verrucomicrobiota bacterium]|jgi:hypothetical protein